MSYRDKRDIELVYYFKKALEDADSAITVDANFARAYVRKAQC